MIAIQILYKLTGDIPSAELTDATSEANTPKNRYQDKIPCEEINYVLLAISFFPSLSESGNHGRVQLRSSATQGSNYINASYIDVSSVTSSSDDPLPHVHLHCLGV